MSVIAENLVRLNVKKEKLGLSFYVFLIAVFSYNLGELISVGPLKLSWLVSFFLIALLPFQKIAKERVKIIAALFAWCLYALAQFAVAYFLSAADNEIGSAQLLSLFINIFVMISALVFVTDEKKLRLTVTVMLLSIVLNAFLGIFEILTASSVMPTEVVKFIGLPKGVYANPNDFGAIMVLGVFLLLLLNTRKKIKKLFFGAGITLFSVMAYLSTSRLAVLSLVILVGCYVFNVAFLRPYNKERKQAASAVTVFALIAFFSVFAYLPSAFAFLLRFLGNESDVLSDFTRAGLIKDALNVFFNSFMFGGGAGSSIVVSNPHNLFVELLAEFGLIWFGFVVGILLSVNNHMYKNKKTDALIPAVLLSFVFAVMISSSAFKLRPIWLFIVLLFLNKNFDKAAEKEV